MAKRTQAQKRAEGEAIARRIGADIVGASIRIESAKMVLSGAHAYPVLRQLDWEIGSEAVNAALVAGAVDKILANQEIDEDGRHF